MWAGMSKIREHEAFTPIDAGKPDASFPSLTAKGRQPGSGAVESKQSRFCSCLPAAHPFIPASPHPSRPQQLWNQLRWAKPKLSHQERTIKQTETEWSDTCQSCMEEAFTTYLCYCEKQDENPQVLSRSLPKFSLHLLNKFSVKLENFIAYCYTAWGRSWLMTWI